MFIKKCKLQIIICVIILGCVLALMSQVVFALDFTVEWPEDTIPSFHGSQYMATGTVPVAIMAGVKILEQGGNATDAGIAIHAAANVADASLTGLGGDCVMLIYDANQDKVTSIQALGWAPKKPQ